MDDPILKRVETIVAECSPEERWALFQNLRATHQIHVLEEEFDAPAEIILEAIYRAPELTRRMLKGVIADAAFARYAATTLAEGGWRDVTPPGNFAFDCLLADVIGQVSVQVKLQRSEKGVPLITTGSNYGLAAGMFMVEVQRTRDGTKRIKKDSGKSPTLDTKAPKVKTRPYRYGDFDVLAVALYPSTKNWHSFRYTVGHWLLPGKTPEEIHEYQPVAREPNEEWTDNFDEVVQWFRATQRKTITNTSAPEVEQFSLF